MRRLALVAEARDPRSGRELDEVFRWLSTLPSGGLTRSARASDVALEQVDVLWLRGVADPHPRLLDWLRTGGRVLATHDAALLPSALGLEPEPPAAIARPDPLPAEFGLAGFGPHPFFTGLREGAVLSPWEPPGCGWLRGYAGGRRPGAAAVVAVERRGLDVREMTTLAWEYAVGAGGVLCLAFDPGLLHGEAEVSRREAEVVLANALVGEAIPHRERATPVAVWPAPGRGTTRGESPGPLLVAPGEPWRGSSLPLLDLTPAAEWTHAGRRLLVSARPATGRREVWAPPFRVMHDAAVRNAIPCAPGHVAADEIAGGLAVGGYRLLERWLAAPDVPLVVWEIGGRDGLEVVAEWEVDLRRSWPYPDGAYGEVSYAAAPDGRSLGVETVAGPRALFAVTGGELAVDAPAGRAAVRVTCRGSTPLRVVAAAGVDQEELQRAVHVLQRDGVQELAGARARKAAQLQRYGTAFEAPDDLLARGFAWARQRGDEALVGAPGVGRSVLAACPRGAGDDAWCFGTGACAAAAAQLIAGNRDPARELLKFLAQTQHPGGGIAAYHPLGGLSSTPDPASTAAFLELAERLLAWTGDEEGLRRIGGPLARALAYLAERAGPAPRERVLDAMEMVAERAGVSAIATLRSRAVEPAASAAVEAHAVVQAAAAALRRAPGALHGTGAAPALLESVAALWGLEPDAPDAALGVAPALPSGWDGFALRRLRLGRSLLDLEVRRRPQAILVRVAHLFGPRLVLTVGVRGAEVETMDVDDVPLSSARARFETRDRHEVRFHLRG